MIDLRAPKRALRRAGLGAALALSIFAIPCPAAPPTAMASPTETIPPLPRIVHTNGVPTLEVDGAPFLVLGAQCDIWRSTRQDDKAVAFFDGFRDMNATTVSVGIPWSKVELEQDRYDFSFIDWFVEKARSRGLRLVLNLFNTNVCGKVQEGAGSSVFPGYTPGYILDHPDRYQRMVLPYSFKYVDAGPPMCPNDPQTLDRERRYVRKVAEHLRKSDRQKTVIMLQLNNEFYYQQWDGKRPAPGAEELSIRCQCPRCLAKWKTGQYANGEQFMFESFADYVRALTDAIADVYPLPMYVNSPWWPPRVIPIFLKHSPNLAFVGIDGILSPREPNWLSTSMLDRNIPFAAENPTENSEVRSNLDVLPYYTAFGRPGIGNLLWECHAPYTVVDDPDARKRYGEALYPLRNAMVPLTRARGTNRLLAWYALRDFRSDLTTDVFGNFVPSKPDQPPVSADRWFVREGTACRAAEGGTIQACLDGLRIEIDGCPAGAVVRTGPDELIIALPKGRVGLPDVRGTTAERGRFVGDRWRSEGAVELKPGKGTIVEVDEPSVIRLTLRKVL